MTTASASTSARIRRRAALSPVRAVLVAFVVFLVVPTSRAFSPTPRRLFFHCRRNAGRRRPFVSQTQSNHDNTNHDKAPILDDVRSSSPPTLLQPLFQSTATAATTLRDAVTTTGSHDPFRYEWGTWIDPDALQDCLTRINQVRVPPGAFERLLDWYAVPNPGDLVTNTTTTTINPARRVRLAWGPAWDIVLHVLPQHSFWRGRERTGSWSLLKPLLGVTEVAMLRESNLQRQATTKELRGGSDGTLGGGGGISTNGEDAIKYVGGPIRSYTAKSGKTLLLEVIIRPPTESDGEDGSLSDVYTLTNPMEEILAVVTDEEILDEHGEDSAATKVAKKDTFVSSTEREATKSEKQGKTMDPQEPSIDPLVSTFSLPTEADLKVEQPSSPSSSLSSSTSESKTLGSALGMTFEQVGGLDDQLEAIARRVLASRANPTAARRLGVSHVRGILLSGPPGCGKTLLARELARLLDAREPQIVNGPEILDKFIGEAEKKVRALFGPAQREYAQVGDDSALHIIVLDEMDAIAKKRGTVSSDTTGVRDSVVNQLLSCMDGIKEANNVLVVGLTNRPELIDPAMLRPGRLEVQLRVELPDRPGRRDILRIHTRQMKAADALSEEALAGLGDLSDKGIPARTEHFSGAELAGLVRSAASFALARTVQNEPNAGVITVADLEQAMSEVLPALGKQDEVLRQRFPLGISPCSPSMERIMRDLERFTAPITLPRETPRLESLLLVGAGNKGGAGATALAAWAAAKASAGGTDYVRLVTALDLIVAGEGGGGGDEARAASLVERFGEAREMSHSLLVLDDVDQLCAGTGPGRYSNVMLATLRALLRTPPENFSTAKAGGESQTKREQKGGKTLQIIAATSRSDSACGFLNDIFDETLVVPLLTNAESVRQLFADSLNDLAMVNADSMADLIIDRLGSVGCKAALRLAERAVASASIHAGEGTNMEEAQMTALKGILDDLAGDELTAQSLCEVI